MEMNETKYFTEAQLKLLRDMYNDKTFFVPLTTWSQELIRKAVTQPTFISYGPSSRVIYNRLREMWIKYKQHPDS